MIGPTVLANFDHSVERRRRWVGLIVVVFAFACLPNNSVQWAWEPIPKSVSCVVAIDAGATKVAVTEETRRACVAMADLVEPVLPPVTTATLREGPPSDRPLRSDEDVWCRLVPREKDGGSLKFRCMRTNARNQFYDEDGVLAPGAVSFDADGVLLDIRKRPMKLASGAPRKGDELRVKYFMGEYPNARHREMFTETVVSHLFWALGIPVDRVYMPASVRCFGCSANPFGQMKPETASAPRVFRFASVERRYPGKKINTDRKRGWMGLGGGYEHGFAFAELEGLATQSPKRKVETEILVGALNIVAYNSPSSYQNELVCRPQRWDKATGVCESPVAYVQDIGGTLGGEKARAVAGLPVSTMRNHPRGDWATFSAGGVFRDVNECRLLHDIAGVEQLSEAGRQALVARISQIGMTELLLILEKANIHRMDSALAQLAVSRSRLPAGRQLDRYIQRMWASEIDRRFKQIQNARCPR